MSENATPPTGEGASARQLLFYEQATPVTAERHGTWSVELGRFQGTSPNTGTSYDEEALRLVGPRQTTTSWPQDSSSACPSASAAGFTSRIVADPGIGLSRASSGNRYENTSGIARRFLISRRGS